MHTVCKTKKTQKFSEEVKRRGLRFRLSELKTSSAHTPLRFASLQAYDVSYAYRLSREQTWLVTPEKISGETPEFIFEFGVAKSADNLKGKYSLYHFGKKRFFMAPSTDEERSVFFGKRVYRTGYVTRRGDLYVNPVDFFDMAGINCQQYEDLRKKNRKRPTFVMRLRLSETERFVEFYRDDKKRKLNGWFENRYVKRSGDIDIEFKVEPIKYTTFALPKIFLDVCNLSGEHYLPTEYDEKSGRFRIECPVSVCSCCGKVIHWDGSHEHETGLACSECAEIIPVLNNYMTARKVKTLPTAKRLEKAVDAILGKTNENAKFLTDLRSETTALTNMLRAVESKETKKEEIS